MSETNERARKYTIIKEVTSNEESSSALALIRTNCYGHDLAFFDDLAGIALTDFPELTRSDIRVVTYGGRFFKRTMGIEWLVKLGWMVPAGYNKISESHPLL